MTSLVPKKCVKVHRAPPVMRKKRSFHSNHSIVFLARIYVTYERLDLFCYFGSTRCREEFSLKKKKMHYNFKLAFAYEIIPHTRCRPLNKEQYAHYLYVNVVHTFK